MSQTLHITPALSAKTNPTKTDFLSGDHGPFVATAK
jgi:hypothetical protein